MKRWLPVSSAKPVGRGSPFGVVACWLIFLTLCLSAVGCLGKPEPVPFAGEPGDHTAAAADGSFDGEPDDDAGHDGGASDGGTVTDGAPDGSVDDAAVSDAAVSDGQSDGTGTGADGSAAGR